MNIWSLITGFAGGVIAWLFTTTLTQPFQRFIELRREAALALTEFEDRLWIGNPEAKPPTEDWLEKRFSAYDKAGTALIAFAISNSFLTRFLHHSLLGRYRCYVRAAGENLRVLAAAYPGTPVSTAHHDNIVRELRIATGMATIKRRRSGKVTLTLGLLAWIVTGVGSIITLSHNPYSREANSILTALGRIPTGVIALLVVSAIGLLPISVVLGAPSTAISYIWNSFKLRWKDGLGILLLITTAVAILTRSSPFWR